MLTGTQCPPLSIRLATMLRNVLSPSPKKRRKSCRQVQRERESVCVCGLLWHLLWSPLKHLPSCDIHIPCAAKASKGKRGAKAGAAASTQKTKLTSFFKPAGASGVKREAAEEPCGKEKEEASKDGAPDHKRGKKG